MRDHICSKKADALLKRDSEEWLCGRVVEFNFAFHRRDFAHVWRVGRRQELVRSAAGMMLLSQTGLLVKIGPGIWRNLMAGVLVLRLFGNNSGLRASLLHL